MFLQGTIRRKNGPTLQVLQSTGCMAFPLVLKSAFDPRSAAVWLSDLTLASKEGAIGQKI